MHQIMAIRKNKSVTTGPVSDTVLTVRYCKLFSYFTAVLALATGGAIYMLFRSSELLFFKWIHLIGAGNFISGIREFSLPLLNHIPEWLIFSLPNGLWAFAYTLIILKIWSGSKSQMRCFWYATIPVLVFGWELFQLFGVMPGTFCWFDTLFSLTGITVVVALFSKQIIPEETK